MKARDELSPPRRARGTPTQDPPVQAQRARRKPSTRPVIDETIACHGLMMLEIEPGLFWCPDQSHDGQPDGTGRTPAFRGTPLRQ